MHNQAHIPCFPSDIRQNENVLKYKGGVDYDKYEPDLTDTMSSDYILYQVTLRTSPGQGLYEGHCLAPTQQRHVPISATRDQPDKYVRETGAMCFGRIAKSTEILLL